MDDEQEYKILMRPMWERCDCEDYWCHLHGMHAYECCCPELDTWLEQLDTTPYDIEVPVVYDADDPCLELEHED